MSLYFEKDSVDKLFFNVIVLNRIALGDELLMWTIETFTLFYERTWAQRFLFPLFGLMPLFISISRFIKGPFMNDVMPIGVRGYMVCDGITKASINKRS